jgi:hypothetical protein
MRFMIMVKATKDSEAGVMPSTELLAEMGKFNEELTKAGVSQSVMDAIGDPKSALASGGAPASEPAKAAPAALAPRGSAGAVSVAAPSGEATAFPPDLANTPSVHKRRLAVKPFDYSTVRTWVNYWFKTDYNIGDGIRAMLVARMRGTLGRRLPDVDALGADVYLFSLYKTYGPHQGLMVVRAAVLEALGNQGHYFNTAYPRKRLVPAGPVILGGAAFVVKPRPPLPPVAAPQRPGREIFSPIVTII